MPTISEYTKQINDLLTQKGLSQDDLNNLIRLRTGDQTRWNTLGPSEFTGVINLLQGKSGNIDSIMGTNPYKAFNYLAGLQGSDLSNATSLLGKIGLTPDQLKQQITQGGIAQYGSYDKLLGSGEDTYFTNDLYKDYLRTNKDSFANFTPGAPLQVNYDRTPSPQMVDTTPPPVPGSGTYAEDLAKSFDTQKSTLTSPSKTYSVPTGSNLSRAAQANGMTLQQLLDLNPEYKSNPNFVKAGAILKLSPDNQVNLGGATPPAGSGSGTSNASANPTGNSSPVVGSSSSARADEIARIKKELEGGLTQPTPYKSLDEFDKLRKEKGVVNDEAELSSIRNEAALGKEELRKFSVTAGQGMSEGGRLGAVSEVERNLNFRLEGLAIRESAVIDRLNSKNAYINTALSLGQQDYKTALDQYNTEYNKNLKAIDIYNTNLNEQQKDAMTAWTSIGNLLKDQNTDFSKLDPALKTQISTLELKAGIPKGTFEAIMKNTPEQKLLSPITVDNPDGTKSVYFYTQDSKTGLPKLIKTDSLGSSGGGTGDGANDPIVQIILGSGKFTKQQAMQITQSINNGEDPFTVVKNQAKNLMGQTEATKVTSYEVARDTLNDIGNQLKQFYAAGGSTGLIKGNFEKIINNLGQVKDPKLVDLATQIQGNIQIYRNAISGTAYSNQEGKDIASIFPGINKSASLNSAILNARKTMFDSIIDASYRSALGSSYDKMKANEQSSTAQVSEDDIKTSLDSIGVSRGSDGFVSPQDWEKIKNAWVGAGNDLSTIDSVFGKLKNPSNPYYK